MPGIIIAAAARPDGDYAAILDLGFPFDQEQVPHWPGVSALQDQQFKGGR
jgi:hypothetical protein